MENHPIPQDITGFEFKLIGSMTLKQFAYVAGGATIGWILFILPLFVLIKIPLVLFFIGFGVSLAFMPVEGRPLDLMIRNFFKAVFAPTQYVYQKSPAFFPDGKTQIRGSIPEMSEKQLKEFLNSIPKTKNKLDKKEMVFFQSLNEYGANNPPQPVPGFVSPHAFVTKAPTATEEAPQKVEEAKKEPNLAPSENLQKTAALLQKELMEAKAKEAAQPQINSKEFLEAHQKVLELQKNLNDLLLQKQQLETKLIDLQKKMETQGKPVFTPSLAQEPKETKFVRSIPQNMQKGAGLPAASEFPNIITGIIKDPRGNPLPNILVEVKDSQGNAVRAFKTNALGQFASATPLINGNYTIEFEDPRAQNKFDSVAFSAKGEVILPIEIISVDTREELRRSLFN